MHRPFTAPSVKPKPAESKHAVRARAAAWRKANGYSIGGKR